MCLVDSTNALFFTSIPCLIQTKLDLVIKMTGGGAKRKGTLKLELSGLFQSYLFPDPVAVAVTHFLFKIEYLCIFQKLLSNKYF